MVDVHLFQRHPCIGLQRHVEELVKTCLAVVISLLMQQETKPRCYVGRCRTLQALQNPLVVTFVREAFAEVRVTTTLLETNFAMLRQWLLRSSRPLHMATLSARFVLHTFFEAWRLQLPVSLLQASSVIPAPHCSKRGIKRIRGEARMRAKTMRRPIWSKRAKVVTGKNIFIGREIRRGSTMSAANKAWMNLPEDAKQRLSTDAQTRNKEHKTMHTLEVQAVGAELAAATDANKDMDETAMRGPWLLGNDLYPLRPQVLEEDGFYTHTGFVRKHADQWTAAGNKVTATNARRSDPNTRKSFCDFSWPHHRCSHSIPRDLHLAVRAFVDILMLIVKSEGRQHVPLLRLQNAELSKVCYVQLLHASIKPFFAEFGMYKIDDENDTLLVLKTLATGVPCFVSEIELAMFLLCADEADIHPEHVSSAGAVNFTRVIVTRPPEQYCDGFKVLQIEQLEDVDVVQLRLEKQALEEAQQLVKMATMTTAKKKTQKTVSGAVRRGSGSSAAPKCYAASRGVCASWHVTCARHDVLPCCIDYFGCAIAPGRAAVDQDASAPVSSNTVDAASSSDGESSMSSSSESLGFDAYLSQDDQRVRRERTQSLARDSAASTADALQAEASSACHTCAIM
eukprot:6484056-Amphidinium_carterae.2